MFGAVIAFIDDESGVTAIEYALLAALITLIALPGIIALGIAVANNYQTWTAAVLAAIGSP